ncbi:AFG1/ZapE family ATPase [Pseudarthrobacter sp. S9]|uniref:AFG1/ZapE family ATPase n=1 Tax=Pseudarthrobacter sp. S9 TaxID=3418421 RepID=UPI003D0479B4
MFMARLLKTAAAALNVTLAVTSNYAPEQLLPNPLWHEHFVPTIAVIREMMEIVEIKGPTDFRRTPAPDSAADPGRAAFLRGRIISPGTARQLGAFGLFPPSPSQQRELTPTTQTITAKSADAGLLWSSYAELCAGLTSTSDYLALAKQYRTWVIDGVPSPGAGSTAPGAAGAATAGAWQRFSNVLDVLYDEDITLILVGSGPMDWDEAGLSGRPMPVDTARITSRLSLLGWVESAGELTAEEISGS